MGRPLDAGSAQSKSQVFDPRLSTINHERAVCVTAQFPTGKVQAVDDKKDKGKNLLMNLAITRYIQPIDGCIES